MKVRLRFGKLGKVRWTSHRDVARMWERAFRRASLPVTYTGGFSPRPKIAFGLALPTGCESLAEYLDVDLSETVDVASLPARLTPALPAGIDVSAAAELEVGAPSLQHEVTSCEWRITLRDTGAEGTASGIDPSAVAARAEEILDAAEVVIRRERKGQAVTDDIRPAILTLAAHGPELTCELATQPRGLRPSELLGVLAVGPDQGSVLRTHQWIQRDGARREPLPLDATAAPHAEVRAS